MKSWRINLFKYRSWMKFCLLMVSGIIQYSINTFDADIVYSRMYLKYTLVTKSLSIRFQLVVKHFNTCNLSTLGGTHSLFPLIDKVNDCNKCLVNDIYTSYIILHTHTSFFSVICYLTIHTAVKPFNTCNLSILSDTHSVSPLTDKTSYWSKRLVCHKYTICIYVIFLKIQYHKNGWSNIKSQRNGHPLQSLVMNTQIIYETSETSITF